MNINRILFFAMAILAIAAGAILYAFAPEQHSFYPQCFFLKMTGWQCPGCGSLRAMHSMLHGNIDAAFAYNPLLILLMPALAVGGAWALFCKVKHRDRRLPFTPICLWALLGIVIVFAVARNLVGDFPR